MQCARRCLCVTSTDLYTFDIDGDAARRTYEDVCLAYGTILHRLGLQYTRAAADSGNIGGSLSHEYHVLASVGEDQVVLCRQCGYAANMECAMGNPAARPTGATAHVYRTKPLRRLLLCIIGDQDTLNVTAVMKHLQCDGLLPAEAALTPRPGALGAEATVLCDASLPDDMLQTVCAQWGLSRASVHQVDGIRHAVDGDRCTAPSCSGHLEVSRGIEVGHTFYLGKRYADSFSATVTNRNRERVVVVRRTRAALGAGHSVAVPGRTACGA